MTDFALTNREKELGNRGAYYFPDELFEHPTEVLCRRCYDDGFRVRCKSCAGTGRKPIPFSEVWGIE